ncbi:hypothetical protein Trydic_g14784 [Trypoxylus dichotomus]
MDSRRQKKTTEKPKNKYTICCFCLNSSSSDIELSRPIGDNEAYDYVVEKLAIKKVPIALFATDEDLAEMENISASSLEPPFSAKDKRSAMVFSSCYSKISKNGKNSQSELGRRMGLDSQNIPKGFNQMSSYKNKDNPKHISLPHELASAENKHHSFPVSVEVHSEPAVKTDMKKFFKLSPQLHETIQQLGTKQRPSGHPGVVPRIISRSANDQTINRISVENPLQQPSSSEPEDGVDVSSSLSFHQRLLKRLFPSQEKNVSSKGSEELQPSKDTLKNEVGGAFSSGANKIGGSSQKWKIIIKEHEGKDTSKAKDSAVNQQDSTESSSEYSTTTDSASETE